MKQNKIPRNEYIRKPVGKTNPYKHDVLYTNLGQWKYPGQVTKIPSNDITMVGVDYPVYGEDDLGYGQMMYPGMDYQFPGQYVTETPMGMYGGDPSLPNITGHYKTGGWLDQYQKGGFNIYNDPNTLFVQQHSRQVLNPNFNEQEPVTGVDKNLLVRQQFKESTFNPKAVSPAKARGLAQIKKDAEADAIKAGVLKKGEDIFDPEVNARVQKWYMNDLYDSSFINKPGQKDSVKLAKALAAYNWGRGNTLKHLNEQKKKGIDIYNSYDWVNSLPKETKDYVNKILLKKDPKFEKEFEKAYEKYPYKEDGGSIGEDEFRRGGLYTPSKIKRKAKKYGTSKNIQSSINKLFTRNYDVFGPGGKNIYNPNVYKTGGWLDFVD